MTGFIKITPQDIRMMSSMRQTTALVWMRLLIYGGKNGLAWPKQNEIAEELGTSKASITRAYKDLKGLGLLEIVEKRAHSMRIRVKRVSMDDYSQDKRVITDDHTELAQITTQSDHACQRRVITDDYASSNSSKVIEKVIDQCNSSTADTVNDTTINQNSFCSERPDKSGSQDERLRWIDALVIRWSSKMDWLVRDRDYAEVVGGCSLLQVQKACHKIDRWLQRQSKQQWSSRIWLYRVKDWIKSEKDTLTSADRGRMRGSGLVVDPVERKEVPKPAENEPAPPIPTDTPARSIWARLCGNAADYEQRFEAVQKWMCSDECTQEIQLAIKADPALEDFAFMLL